MMLFFKNWNYQSILAGIENKTCVVSASKSIGNSNYKKTGQPLKSCKKHSWSWDYV